MNIKWAAIIVSIIAALGGFALAAEQAANNPAKTNVSYRPSIVVYKSFHCDCCMKWVEYLEAHRFNVRVESMDDLKQVKNRVGVPANKDSCHTAVIDGYFIEGHVPVEDIKRLIRTKPNAKGLTVPGMPIGSPGMEQGKLFQPYDVLLVDKAGNTTVFARHEK
jgi:hypothetical protein